MKYFLTLTSVFFSIPSFALSQTGKVTGYIPYEAAGKEVLIVQMQGNAAGGCNSTGRFAIDSSTMKFKGTSAAAIAAFHAQSDVTIIYTQTCNAWGNAWDIQSFCVGAISC